VLQRFRPTTMTISTANPMSPPEGTQAARQEDPQQIHWLTAIRGIAAAGVVVFHLNARMGLNLVTRVPAISKLYLFVDLFFVLSGFILSHVYGQTFRRGVDRKSFVRFVFARLARVYPLHVATLTCSILMWIAWPSSSPKARRIFDPSLIKYHLALLHSANVSNNVSWNDPSWSISAEWISYLIFPIMAPHVLCQSRRRTLVVGTILVSLYVVMCYWLRAKVHTNIPEWDAVNNLDLTFKFGWLRGLTGFTAGVLTYQVKENAHVVAFFKHRLTPLLLISSLCLCLHFQPSDVLIVLHFPLIIGMLSMRDYDIRTLFRRWLVRLGDVSFAIYMVHMPLIRLLLLVLGLNWARQATTVVRCFVVLGYLVILYVVAEMTYRLIEVPCRDIMRRWLRSHRAR
jgi:peptidoglycan/LPS O-acetylase OafA/YrhL